MPELWLSLRRQPMLADAFRDDFVPVSECLTHNCALSVMIKCEHCVKGKATQKPYPESSTHHTKQPLNLIHSDVCGPMKTLTPGKNKYMVTFIDDLFPTWPRLPFQFYAYTVTCISYFQAFQQLFVLSYEPLIVCKFHCIAFTG